MADTSTTAPPKQPTAADVDLLSFAIGLELAMIDLYAKNAAGAKGDAKAVAEQFGANHRAAAQALSGLVARKAPTTRNAAFFAEHAPKVTGDAKETAAYIAGLENALVATHLKVLGSLRGVDGANLVASILPTEARHAAVLVGLSGSTSLDDIMALDAEAAIDPEKFPA